MTLWAYSKTGLPIGPIIQELGDRIRVDRKWFIEDKKGATNIVFNGEYEVGDPPSQEQLNKVLNACKENIDVHKRNW